MCMRKCSLQGPYRRLNSTPMCAICCGPSPLQLRTMSKLGTWGDHITLQAAADAFFVGINVITSFLENCVITISPTVDDKRPPDSQVSNDGTVAV